MSKRQNLLAVWQQIPVANRLVEVNTKTGFSLTAGSYVIHASSNQRGTISVAAATSNTGAISSVTITRAAESQNNFSGDAAGGAAADVIFGQCTARLTLTNATTLTATKIVAAGTSIVSYLVEETF